TRGAPRDPAPLPRRRHPAGEPDDRRSCRVGRHLAGPARGRPRGRRRRPPRRPGQPDRGRRLRALRGTARPPRARPRAALAGPGRAARRADRARGPRVRGDDRRRHHPLRPGSHGHRGQPPGRAPRPGRPAPRPRTPGGGQVSPPVISRGLLAAGLLGGVATAAGIALTTTSGWLIVRADQRPQILTLLTAIVAVRAFGLARPVFRHWERLRSHDVALGDLARERTRTYASLIPLTPARLGSRGRADVLTGVVDDLSDVVEASVRVTVPAISALVAGVLAAALTAAVDARVGLVLASMLSAALPVAVLADRLETRSQTEVLTARAEVARVAQLVSGHADELRGIGGTATATGWL